jgi:very-short-patch-repair endonuclease
MESLDFVKYNISLVSYARKNRKNQTRQEWIFWNLILKDKNLMWYKFTRQKPISSFILDFYCSELLLWIEIDGWYHNDRQDYDRVRDSEIKRFWIKVIRFTNDEVDKNLEWIVDELKKIISNRVLELWKIQ